jgi:uncharacterized protein YqeY
MLESKLEQDIKTALLAGDSVRVTTLRGLKATLLNVKVAQGKRDEGLTDEEVLPIFAKEAKKRQESADMYKKGDATERAEAELVEKGVIEEYLPKQLSEDEITELVKTAIAGSNAEGMQAMGQVIGQVKAKAGAAADGSVIARIVKEQLA